MPRYAQKLTETCYINQATMLATIRPTGMEEWVVINADGIKQFGPKSFGACVLYMVEQARKKGIYYSIEDYRKDLEY